MLEGEGQAGGEGGAEPREPTPPLVTDGNRAEIRAGKVESVTCENVPAIVVDETRTGDFRQVVPTLQVTAGIISFASCLLDSQGPFPTGNTVGEIRGKGELRSQHPSGPAFLPDVPFQHAIVPSRHGRILGSRIGDVRDRRLGSLLAAFPPL